MGAINAMSKDCSVMPSTTASNTRGVATSNATAVKARWTWSKLAIVSVEQTRVQESAECYAIVLVKCKGVIRLDRDGYAPGRLLQFHDDTSACFGHIAAIAIHSLEHLLLLGSVVSVAAGSTHAYTKPTSPRQPPRSIQHYISFEQQPQTASNACITLSKYLCESAAAVQGALGPDATRIALALRAVT